MAAGLKREAKERQEILGEKERELILVRDELERMRHRMGDLNNK